ncbi:MAG: ABC transporter permease [Betaproteobacteria bacterium]|nr:ABC transporter permease [Betaproteobacteria bacterium]
MLRFVYHRALLMIPTLLGVAILVFAMLRMMPGDPLTMMFEGANVAKEVVEAERARLGLDQPIYVQFVKWLWGVLHGDLGLSMWTGKSVAYEIGIRLELSLQVAVMATILAILLALPLGTLSAIYKDTWVDHTIRVFSIAGLAVPSFWLGMIIILSLLTVFSWIPPLTFTPFFEDPKANLLQLIWPAMAVGYRYSAVSTRMMRSSILEVLQEDYIRTARAKGVFERLVISRHALRNALLPVVTVIGLEFAFLIGGLVVTEQVFNLNGIGRLFVQAVARDDYTMVQGLVLLVAVVFVMVNFFVDMLYAVLDPRIRYR